MSKKLLFISSTNLTVNPRLLKELKLAIKLAYEVDFVGFKLGNWSDKIDSETIKNIDSNFHYISITRKPFIKWFINSILEKISKKLYPFLKNSLKLNAYAYSKRSILLNKYLRNNKKKYDLIIAHTLPTLYPAYVFAKKTNTKFTFDIEDYHPGEIVTIDAENEKARRIFLMQKLLPKAEYITYASPLIGEHSLKLLKSYSNKQHQLINNCFSQSEFQFKENNSEKINFVWFSQNIAAGRGLELILPALEKFKDQIELTLIGNLYTDFYDNFLSEYANLIKIVQPLLQGKLNLKLSDFDIGLAVELNTADLNRKICLTNKIWAYFQSGLYILATNTPAQIKFLEESKNAGLVSEQNIKNFTSSIAEICEKINQIRKYKKQRFDDAQKFAWENESKKLKEVWNRII